MALRSAVMKLLAGAVAYLAVVAVLVVAVFAGVSSLERRQPKEPPVLAMETDHGASMRERAIEEAKVDPNRVPVWIAPTAKYEYTPVTVEPRPKHTPVIGKDARGAMAKAPPRARPRPERRADEGGSPPPRAVDSRRDNDPFFRD